VQQGSLSESRQSRQLSRVLRLAPDHPSGQVAFGNLAVQSGDFDAAMLHYAEVANEDGAGANNLGVVLLRQAVPAAALQTLLLSTQMEPDVAVTHQNLGIAYQQLGQQREAVRAFKEVLRIDPTLIIARYHLGMHYLSQGDFVEAGIAFERVLEQDAGCVPAHIGLGLVYIEVEDWQRAKPMFEEAARLDPGSITAQFYLGWTQMRMGAETEARITLNRVLELYPPQDLVERVTDMLNRETGSD